ncbi:hypothetical protein M422DRAFT_244625 [Sphaerobolus stellatus SS14]|nr:hypothetical protein M422DRAFT_244625 [Sphaerobolus stellatus SS14]
MAQTLLAILFATSSANDQTIAFRWPPSPSVLPRLARPRPPSQLDLSHADAPYRAATYQEGASSNLEPQLTGDRLEYEWQRPTIKRYRSQSFASSGRSSSTGRHSPVVQRNDRSIHIDNDISEYETIFEYHVDLLAHFLCPMKDNCHQKFELIVDDLVFIGHPVCVDDRGAWSFKDDVKQEEKHADENDEGAKERESGSSGSTEKSSDSLLKTFHVIFVLDLPDPASSASGNLNKYFDTVYQTAAFSLTAALFNEQVLHGYVETEWELLMKLKEDCISNGEPYDCFVTEALKKSSLARSFEQVYKAIRANSLARLTINNISLDLQLPPYLDYLLYPDPLDPSGSAATTSLANVYGQEAEEDDRLDNDYASWGPELSFGWRLPALTPWKALLLLDVDPEDPQNRTDPLQNLNRPGLAPDEREIAEGISRFLDTASIFVSLNDMATLLDWDLHKQVYPTVRYLVQRRRAKVVDLVRSSLKNVFAISTRIDTPIAELSLQFAKEFPTLPPLPVIFVRISGSHNNFFGSVVQSKENIPIYKNVIIWLLKRDLLVTLHMRFRLIATPTLKQWVAATRKSKREARERRISNSDQVLRGRRRKSSADPSDNSARRSRSALRSTVVLLKQDEQAVEDESEEEGILFSPTSQSSFRGNDGRFRHSLVPPPLLETRYEQWGPGSLIAAQRNRRYSDMSPASRTKFYKFLDQQEEEDEEEDVEEVDESESESDPDDPEDLKVASLISNPERATRKERRWLRGMAYGKNPAVSKRFEKIYRFFDGKTTGDEILYKASISRKELREVLHQFEEHITTFLHP